MNNQQPLSLDPTDYNPQAQNAPVDLDAGDALKVRSPGTARTMASKAQYSDNINDEDGYRAILSGRENNLRQEAASAQDFQNRMTAIRNRQPAPPPTDPNSSLEESFAKKYVGNAAPSLVNAATQDPQGTSDAMQGTATNLMYKEFAASQTKEAMDSYNDQSWTGWAVDQAKMLSGTYIEGKLRSQVPGQFWSGLLGDELESQRKALYGLPFDQYKTQLTTIMNKLRKDNPRLAVLFGNAVIGQSEDDLKMNNASTFLNIGGDLTIAGPFASKFAKKLLWSVSDSTKALEGGHVTPFDVNRAAASGLGNHEEAATQAVQKDMLAKEAGKYDPQKGAVEALNDLRIDSKYRAGNPGASGQEVANRVAENTLRFSKSLEQTSSDLMRVQRAPVLETNDTVAKMAIDAVKDQYSGVNSTVIGTGKKIIWSESDEAPDFIRKKGSNTLWVSVDVGTHDALPFDDIQQAIGHADAYGLTLRSGETNVEAFLRDRITEDNFKIYEKEKNIRESIPHIDETETDVMRSELQALRNAKEEHEGQLERVLTPRKAKGIKNLLASKKNVEVSKPTDIIPAEHGADIVQDGAKFIIRHWVPIDETKSFIRDNLINLPDSWVGSAHKGARLGRKRSGTQVPYLVDPVTGERSTKTWDAIMAFFNSGPSQHANMFAWRSPEETLSPWENAQRKIVTHGINRIMNVIQDYDKLVTAALKDDKVNFKRVLIHNQNMINPINPQESGYFYRTIPELENWYRTATGRLPSEKFIQGYFAYIDNWEAERTFRTMGMARNMYRLGVQQFRIQSPNKGWSPFFHARPIDSVKSIPSKEVVYVADGIDGEAKVMSGASINQARYRKWQEKVDKGQAKILQLWNHEDRPFHQYDRQTLPTTSEPSYVIAPNIDRKALDWNKLVPRRGGGHWQFTDPYKVVQANIVRDPITGNANYKGDTLAFTVPNRAIGERLAKHFSQLVDFYKRKDVVGAKAYINSIGIQGLDFDKHIHPNFAGKSAGKGGRFPPRFNSLEPFRTIGMNESLIDVDDSLPQRYGEAFHDQTTSSNLAKANAIEFTQKRDAENMFSISDVGTKSNPIFKYHASPLLDPLESLNRSMSRIVNSTFMDDYKYAAVEHWIQASMPWLDIKDPRQARHSPFATFLNAEFRKNAPEQVKAILIGNRRKIRDFIGTPSALDNAIHSISSKLADSIYRGTGKTLTKLEDMPGEKDPVRFFRSMTAHAKLGLGAIPTFWTQASAITNVMAINFKQAPAAAMATLFHEWLRWAPQHLDAVDAMATKLRMPGFSKYKPGEFKEAFNMLTQETGFFDVGGEHASWDTALKNKAITSWKDAALYWGQTAFREGAQAVRTAAWYAAHKEFRDAKPVGAFTRAEKAAILDRATLLDHNMSRASNSALNSGVMSLPAQFYTYARNLAEMMYGKRLTWSEKARLFAVNSAMWGIPAGGIGLFGLPVADQLRKEAIQHGYVPGDDARMSTLMEGLPSWIGAYITGDGDTQAGTWYDFSKFGVKGWDPIDNFLAQDKTFMDFVGGATYSTIANTWNRSKDLWQDFASLGNSSNDGNRFPIKAQHLAELFKEFSGFSFPWKTYMGVSTGKWLSNNNTPLDNVSWEDAIFRGLTGTVPVDVSDISSHRQILDDRASYVKFITNAYARNVNLAMLALHAGDSNGYQSYMTIAKAWLDRADFPPNERMRVIAQINSRAPTLLEGIRDQLHTKDVPQNELEKQQEMFRERENIQDKKDQLRR